LPEQTVQAEVPVAPTTEQVFPLASQTFPAAFPTGWHCESLQSTRPSQLLSIPSLQISVVPPGQAVQVDGEPVLQVWPSASQTAPWQAVDPQVVQVGPVPPPALVKVTLPWPATPPASTARMTALPGHAASSASLQEVKVRVTGVLAAWADCRPLANVPRLVEMERDPCVLPVMVTETAFVPLATTEAGLTVMVKVAVGRELPFEEVDSPQLASSATAAMAERLRIRRAMKTSASGPGNWPGRRPRERERG
jgi:hypothetical protein